MKTSRTTIISTVLAIIVVASAGPILADSGAAHQAIQTPPVKMGTSGGSAVDASNAFCCGGTLGSLVLRDGVLSILSNNHVLGRAGSAVAGEDAIQPGLIDVSCRSANANIVGDYAGNLVPLGSNVDVAISTARSGMVDTSGAILDIGVPCSNTQNATVGLAVRKSGRTTGLTTGSVTSINTSVSIQYQKGCNSGKKFTISYTNQIVTGAMSAGGDSGSLLLSNNDATPNPVGLLYAGSSSTTIYNPIQDVINAFTAGGHTFSFVGAACSSIAAPSGELTESLSIGRGPSANDVDFVRTIKERHEPDLFARPGVIGVGVGAADDDPSTAVIVVYLETPRGARPDPKGLPTELDGVKVKVIPTDPFVSMAGSCSGSN